MSIEMEEKSTRIENEVQKQLVQTIKSSKKEHSPEQRSNISLSSIIQDNTTEVIEKIDSKIPSYVQLYSDLYKKYLHLAGNLFEATYSSQKDIHDKMGVGDVGLVMFDAYLRSVKKMVLLQIDLSENMIKSYVNNRLTVLEFYDQMMSRNISTLAKMCPISNFLING
jgi:hypothetical protein